MSKEFQLGGQALVEGVMMRSPRYVGAAVRCPDGHIETRLESFQSVIRKYPFLNIVIVRGVVGLFEMLALGMKYLQWSGNIALEEEERKKRAAKAAENPEFAAEGSTPSAAIVAQKQGAPALPIWLFLITIVGSLGLGMLLFVALPNLITHWTLRQATDNLIALNLFEGSVKMTIFVIYIWGIGQRPDIRRVFEYHGAEHKVVYAAENDLPLTPENARPFDTPHPRCGTGFALLTVVVSIFCFANLPWPEEHWIRIGWRMLLMPLVAGISYEIIKLTGNPTFGGLARFIMIPGMWLQRLTTKQPDDSQLEVSCVAMQTVIDAEAGHNVVAAPGLV